MLPALALAIVTMAEASIGIFVKLVGDQVPLLAINFYRVFFAALILLPLVAATNRGALRFPHNNLRDVLIIGALIATQISLFNTAMTLAPVANVVVFWSIAPFFVFIFSSLFLNERPRPLYALIFLLAIAGVIIAKPVSLGAGWGPEQLGNVIALSTGAVYAAMVTYLRSEGRSESTVDIFWFMVIASCYLVPGLFFVGPGNLFAPSDITFFGSTVPVITWILGLGFFSTGLAFFCISFVLTRINANIYSLIDIIVSPVMAALLAFLIFTEVPSTSMIVGGSVLLFSGALLTLLRNRPESTSGDSSYSVSR